MPGAWEVCQWTMSLEPGESVNPCLSIIHEPGAWSVCQTSTPERVCKSMSVNHPWAWSLESLSNIHEPGAWGFYSLSMSLEPGNSVIPCLSIIHEPRAWWVYQSSISLKPGEFKSVCSDSNTYHNIISRLAMQTSSTAFVCVLGWMQLCVQTPFEAPGAHGTAILANVFSSGSVR